MDRGFSRLVPARHPPGLAASATITGSPPAPRIESADETTRTRGVTVHGCPDAPSAPGRTGRKPTSLRVRVAPHSTRLYAAKRDGDRSDAVSCARPARSRPTCATGRDRMLPGRVPPPHQGQHADHVVHDEGVPAPGRYAVGHTARLTVDLVGDRGGGDDGAVHVPVRRHVRHHHAAVEPTLLDTVRPLMLVATGRRRERHRLLGDVELLAAVVGADPECSPRARRVGHQRPHRDRVRRLPLGLGHALRCVVPPRVFVVDGREQRTPVTTPRAADPGYEIAATHGYVRGRRATDDLREVGAGVADVPLGRVERGAVELVIEEIRIRRWGGNRSGGRREVVVPVAVGPRRRDVGPGRRSCPGRPSQVDSLRHLSRRGRSSFLPSCTVKSASVVSPQPVPRGCATLDAVDARPSPRTIVTAVMSTGIVRTLRLFTCHPSGPTRSTASTRASKPRSEIGSGVTTAISGIRKLRTRQGFRLSCLGERITALPAP